MIVTRNNLEFYCFLDAKPLRSRPLDLSDDLPTLIIRNLVHATLNVTKRHACETLALFFSKIVKLKTNYTLPCVTVSVNPFRLTVKKKKLYESFVFN